MTIDTLSAKIQLRRGTETEWTTANPILSAGEIGVENDTGLFKLGDGATSWADLEYFIHQGDIVDLINAAGGGVTVHNDLTGRSDADTHPISSITGLAAALAAAGNVDSVNGQTGTVSLDLDDLTDVDTTTDPPDADDVLAWDGVTWTPATLAALGAPGLSNATPADLGTAAPGVATEASRADHVHDLPTAADVGAVASSRSIIAGSGLSGGGDLTVDRTISADFGSGAGKVTEGNDARLSDARTPTAHAASHGNGGTDEIAVDASQITSGTVAQARLGTGSAGAGEKFLADDQTWKAAGGMARLARVSGVKYTLGGGESNSVWCAPTNVGSFKAHPVWLPAGGYNKMQVMVTTAAVSTWRLGIYNGSQDGPTTLLLDAGTLSTNSTGEIIVTVSLTIPTTGIYWAATLCEAYTARPQVWGWAGGGGATPNLPWLGHAAIGNPGGRGFWGAQKNGVATGAMPADVSTNHKDDVEIPQITFVAA